MYLHELPRESKITGLTDLEGKSIVVIFHHVDGMYSYCTIEGTSKVVHLGVMTKLILKDGSYEIDNRED